MSELSVVPAGAGDTDAIDALLSEDWQQMVVAHGAVYRPAELPTLLARDSGGKPVGVLTYRIDGDSLEVVTIDARPRGIGAGTALLAAAEQEARRRRLRRIWLVTTNDNLDALRFYQRRGMRLVAVHPDAVSEARRMKPSIPLTGAYGIPLRDELVLERRTDDGVARERSG
jgi:GNAT superfamily N-acetyltransferase